MYRVAVASNVSSVPSFEAAVKSAKNDTRNFALDLLSSADRVAGSGLYRSPQARARVADGLRRQSANVLKGLEAAKFPRKAGDVSIKAGSANVSIAKV